MAATNDISALERLLQPMPKNLTAELAHALVSLQVDEEIQSRYDELADKRSEGNLTEAEEKELDALVRANTVLGLLKAEAQAMLADNR